MPTELAESHVAFLRGKFEAAQRVVHDVGTPIPEADSIFTSVERGFEHIQENRRLYEQAYDQEPDGDSTNEFYEQYLTAIDNVATELQALEIQLVYFDLYQHQSGSVDSERLEVLGELSSELQSVFGIDITTLPVVWDEFSIIPLDEHLPSTGDISQIYALVLPRMQIQPELYAPIVGHEIAHAVIDRQENLQTQFYNLVSDVQRQTRKEFDDKAHFARSWRDWFIELFCDTCGVLSFGPAYLSSLAWYLHRPNPYHIEKIQTDQFHPPDALRFDLVLELCEMYFPDLLSGVRDDQIAFERHLDALKHNRPRNYEIYDYDEFRDFITLEVPEAVDQDLEALVDDISAGVSPENRPERAHRLAANRYWLEAYPP